MANHIKTELLILSHQLSLLQFLASSAVFVVTLGRQAAWALKKWQNWQEMGETPVFQSMTGHTGENLPKRHEVGTKSDLDT